MTVRAKVATVVSDRDVAFNAGSAAGVAVDDVASVVKRTTVTDPETGEILGELSNKLVNFRIYIVQERYSVGRTFETAQPTDIYAMFLNQGKRPTFVTVTTDRGDTGPSRIFVAPGADVDITRPSGGGAKGSTETRETGPKGSKQPKETDDNDSTEA